jgi:drug/metabolite transporter (DMT)-like permease
MDLSLIQLSLICGFAWGVYPLLNKAIVEDSGVHIITVYGIYIFLVGVMAMILLYRSRDKVIKDMFKMTKKNWLMLFSVSLIFFVAGYLFNYSSVFISPYKSLAFSIAFGSIVSVIGSYFYFNMDITMIQVISMSVIIGGIYVLNTQVEKKRNK